MAEHQAAVTTGERRRRSPERAREQALATGREILRIHGPSAVTLMAVAREIGVTHGALSYHFGSASAFRSAVMAAAVGDLAAVVARAMDRIRADTLEPEAVVNLLFDGFHVHGAGQLAAWIALERFPI